MSVEDAHMRLGLALDFVGEEWEACGQDMTAWRVLRTAIALAAHVLMLAGFDEGVQAGLASAGYPRISRYDRSHITQARAKLRVRNV